VEAKSLIAVKVYVVVLAGVTGAEPLDGTVPKPVIITVLAPVTCQDKIAVLPAKMVLGLMLRISMKGPCM
jgi:hypothetical protein